MSHDDEIFPEFIGDAGGPVEIFQSCPSGNARVIGENSNLNSDGEGIAENSTGSEGNARGSDVNCATLTGSLVDVGGSHLNSDYGSFFGSSGDNRVSDQKEVVTAEFTKLSLKSPSDDDNRSEDSFEGGEKNWML